MSPKAFSSSLVLSLCSLLFVAGCAGPKPIEEYTLARTALQAAKVSGATSAAPGFWHRAEENFRKGQKAFDLNDNILAKEFFERAREYAEKAENAARLQSFRSGGGF